jgi:hypothetical protein
VNAEFNWWLLIVGLVLGAALTWLVMAETVRRDSDVTEREQRSEAAWISALLGGAGRGVSADRVEEILRLHREYLAAPPPDEPPDLDDAADGPPPQAESGAPDTGSRPTD